MSWIVAFEYRSRRTLWGIPLVHVAFGQDPFHSGQRVARGIVAIGPVAVGVVAIGPISLGVIALGQLAAGLALGAGQIACGVLAAGHVAAGWLAAAGQAAFGQLTFGQLTGEMLLPLAIAWGVAGSLGLVLSIWRHGRLAALMGRAAGTIQTAPPGLVFLRGRVVAVRTVEAPVSKRACVGYDVRRVRKGRPPKAEHACEDFVIEDGTGRARVIAEGAVLALEPIKRTAQAVETRIVAHEAAGGRFASRAGGVVRPVGMAHERVLMAGDEVRVTGTAMRQIGGESAAPLVVHGGGAGPVLVTNCDVAELRAETLMGAVLAAVLVTSGLAVTAASLIGVI